MNYLLLGVSAGASFLAGSGAAISGFGGNIIFQMCWILAPYLFHDNTGTLGSIVDSLGVLSFMSMTGALFLGLHALREGPRCINWSIVAAVSPSFSVGLILGTYLAVKVANDHTLELLLGMLFMFFGTAALIAQTRAHWKAQDTPFSQRHAELLEDLVDEENHQYGSPGEKWPTIPLPTKQDAVEWFYNIETWGAVVAGGAWGVLNGLFGVGGPPMMIFFAFIKISAPQIRGVVMVVQLFTIPIRIASALYFGIYYTDEISWYAASFVSSAVGLYLGHFVHVLVDDAFIRTVLYFLTVMASSLLIRPGQYDYYSVKHPMDVTITIIYMFAFVAFCYLVRAFALKQRIKKEMKEAGEGLLIPGDNDMQTIQASPVVSQTR